MNEKLEKLKKLVGIVNNPAVTGLMLAGATVYFRFKTGHWPTFEEILVGLSIAAARVDKLVAGVGSVAALLARLGSKQAETTDSPKD